MNYYLDTEFIEGRQKTLFGTTKPTIDLISIGIVSEDNREFYAISKEFNLKEAWNRCDLKVNKQYPLGPQYTKVYWIRTKVLLPIYNDLVQMELEDWHRQERIIGYTSERENRFTYKNFKRLLKRFGKTNKQIAKDIRNFIACENINKGGMTMLGDYYPNDPVYPVFYADYCNYDWVVFCWLFGKMIDLPIGYPMYCRDLRQMLDARFEQIPKTGRYYVSPDKLKRITLKSLEDHPDFPRYSGEHHALSDAKYDKKVHEFLLTL